MLKVILMVTAIFSISAYAEDSKKAPSEKEWNAYIESLKPEKRNDIRNVRFVFVDVKPGAKDQFETLYKEYAFKMAEKAGIPYPSMYRMDSGEYDFMMIWPLINGYEGLDWFRTENDIKMMKTMKEMFGIEKSMEIFAKHDELVNRTTSYLSGQIHKGSHGE